MTKFSTLASNGLTAKDSLTVKRRNYKSLRKELTQRVSVRYVAIDSESRQLSNKLK